MEERVLQFPVPISHPRLRAASWRIINPCWWDTTLTHTQHTDSSTLLGREELGRCDDASASCICYKNGVECFREFFKLSIFLSKLYQVFLLYTRTTITLLLLLLFFPRDSRFSFRFRDRERSKDIICVHNLSLRQARSTPLLFSFFSHQLRTHTPPHSLLPTYIYFFNTDVRHFTHPPDSSKWQPSPQKSPTRRANPPSANRNPRTRQAQHLTVAVALATLVRQSQRLLIQLHSRHLRSRPRYTRLVVEEQATWQRMTTQTRQEEPRTLLREFHFYFFQHCEISVAVCVSFNLRFAQFVEL